MATLVGHVSIRKSLLPQKLFDGCFHEVDAELAGDLGALLFPEECTEPLDNCGTGTRELVNAVLHVHNVLDRLHQALDLDLDGLLSVGEHVQAVNKVLL